MKFRCRQKPEELALTASSIKTSATALLLLPSLLPLRLS